VAEHLKVNQSIATIKSYVSSLWTESIADTLKILTTIKNIDEETALFC